MTSDTIDLAKSDSALLQLPVQSSLERLAEYSGPNGPTIEPKAMQGARPRHFRPIDFQTKVEIDRFFGQTKQQKNELALHVKDEEGRWWYDVQEQDENRGLLCPYSPVSPAIVPSRRGSGYSSAPTSPTIGGDISGQVSLDSSVDRRSDQSQSPPTILWKTMSRRRFSGQLLGLAKPLEIISAGSATGLDLAYSIPLARHDEPFEPLYSTHAGTQSSVAQMNDKAQLKDIRPRAKRSQSTAERLNIVGESLPAPGKPDEAQLEPTVEKQGDPIRLPAYLPLPHRRISTQQLDEAFSLPRPHPGGSESVQAIFPAEVPLQGHRRQRHRPSRLDLPPCVTFKQSAKRRSLGSPFSPCTAGSVRSPGPSPLVRADTDCTTQVDLPEPITSPKRRSLTMFLSGSPTKLLRSGSTLASNLHITKSPHRPWSSHGTLSPSGDSDTSPTTERYIRRRSSASPFSSPKHPPTQGSGEEAISFGFVGVADAFSTFSPPPSYEVDSLRHHRMTGRHENRGHAEMPLDLSSPVSPLTFGGKASSSNKADALLGANPLNRNLLAPAGLPTGPDVYDGLVIDGASFRLGSDDGDESDKDEGRDKRSGGGSGFGSGNVKRWLRKRGLSGKASVE